MEPDPESTAARKAPRSHSGDPELVPAVIILERVVLGVTLGVVCGLGLFAATLWLVVKGGSQVGPHLQLLNQFFIGYSVTLQGSFVGLVYGFLCGFASGWIIATVYNRVVSWQRK